MGDRPSNGQSHVQELNNTKPTKCLSLPKKVLDIVLAQWLVIGFGLSCLLAYFFPSKDKAISSVSC